MRRTEQFLGAPDEQLICSEDQVARVVPGTAECCSRGAR